MMSRTRADAFRAEIAVVIPCHDLGRFVGEAVESVLAQTRPAAEVIVVDDGSTDLYTRQVLAALDRPRTRVVRTPNRGLPAARNHGIRLTSSPYVVALDADDVLEPTYLEVTAGRLDAEPTLAFVTTAIVGFADASYVWTPPPCDLLNALTRGGAHPASMFRRRLWEAVGGFDETSPIHGVEDLDFWISAMEQGFRGAALPEPLLRYRVRAGSMHHGAVARGTYRRTMEGLLAKHRGTIERMGPEVFLAKEAFLVDQRENLRQLERRTLDLTRELEGLEAEISRARDALRAQGRSPVDWGDLRRLEPLSPVWGVDRGKPVNRYYIERFLASHRDDIRGRVLEVKDAGYTELFGTGVTRQDVLDLDPGNPRATIVADLTRAEVIRDDTFDCVILTQVLNVNFDLRGALGHARRILTPGGVLLCTVASLDRVSYEDRGVDGDYWRLTEASMRELCAELFPLEAFEVTTYGNVLACAAHLYGLAAGELSPEELDASDPRFPLIVAVRAVKPCFAAPAGTVRGSGDAVSEDRHHAGAILAYHRVASLSPDGDRFCVSPGDFRVHMEHLVRHYRPVTLEDLVAAAREGSIPAGAVAVTIDDGYLDALTVASEILAELDVPATFFVNTDRLDEEHEPGRDTLERIFLSGLEIPRIMDLDLGGQRVRRATATDEERAAACAWLDRLTHSMSAADRSRVIRSVAGWSGLDLAPRPTHRRMTGPELLRLAGRPGHAIGAHTVHHLDLPSQPLETQRWEVVESKRRLERLLGRPVRAFAYPYGRFEDGTVEVVREASFEVAVTAVDGVVLPGANPLRLPRLEVRPAAGRDGPGLLAAFLRSPRQC